MNSNQIEIQLLDSIDYVIGVEVVKLDDDTYQVYVRTTDTEIEELYDSVGRRVHYDSSADYNQRELKQKVDLVMIRSLKGEN